MFTTVATVLALAAVSSATKSLSVSVSAPDALTDVSALEVVATVTNTGDEAVKLLKDPRSVLSSWATHETFSIVSDSFVEPEFTGVFVRYLPEVVAASNDEDSFTILAAGESVEVAHEVGNYFNFTSAGAGTFSFTPSNVFTSVESDGSLSTIEASVDTAATVSLSGQLSSTAELSPRSLGGSPDMRKRDLRKRATFTSCTSTRQTQTNSAITAARNYATRSVSHLQSNPSGSSLQTEWFGTFATARYNVVLSSFQSLVGAPANWNYDCSCTDSGVYAYVYTNRYGEVFLCGYFWQAPATGAGSRADTIIHEGTHFPQILGTSDYTYGQANSRALARSNPRNAVYNADNHAFFSAAA